MPLSHASFFQGLLPTWIGITPGTVLYVYIGSLAGSLASLGTEGRTRTPAVGIYAVGLVCDGHVVTLYVTRIAHKL